LGHALGQHLGRRIRDLDGTPATGKNRRSPVNGSRSVDSITARVAAANSSTTGTPRATPAAGGSTIVNDSTFSGRRAAAYIDTIAP
jgi:hypothetical protein